MTRTPSPTGAPTPAPGAVRHSNELQGSVANRNSAAMAAGQAFGTPFLEALRPQVARVSETAEKSQQFQAPRRGIFGVEGST